MNAFYLGATLLCILLCLLALLSAVLSLVDLIRRSKGGQPFVLSPLRRQNEQHGAAERKEGRE